MADILDVILEHQRERKKNAAGGLEKLKRLELEIEALRKDKSSTDEGRLEYRFRVIRTEEGLDSMLKELEDAPDITFDIETTGVDPFSDKLVG